MMLLLGRLISLLLLLLRPLVRTSFSLLRLLELLILRSMTRFVGHRATAARLSMVSMLWNRM
ncbi:hypothetical protein ANAPC1_00893 [Anaplasma phagocytophilum]|uniref:Uncharacterized protein n=1 Tax=Anaplasma phagocytophilum TaxID=948 RepID=A0AA45ZHQ6_ANAPH|nr:hypothetical protein ANAPC1_00893 [Anaplasma phagocytophilum]SBO33591.1 hypothetical protein ANAPC2_01400 [Anaplasma phagocytophilum]SBO33920.1 hypothetical protein ANAPC4_01363 [Anaplasma phagocytophilum]